MNNNKKCAFFLLPILAGDSVPALAEGFLEDSRASLALRNFYMNRDFRDGAGRAKSEEWAQGFLFDYRSGYTEGTLGVGLDLLGKLGVRLDSGAGRSGTGLLPLRDDGSAAGDYARLDATAKLRLSRSELKVGGLVPKLPTIQPNYGRLFPQVFQGALLTSGELSGLSLNLGRLTEVSQRNEAGTSDLALFNRNRRFAGAAQADRFDLAGLDYRIAPDWTGRPGGDRSVPGQFRPVQRLRRGWRVLLATALRLRLRAARGARPEPDDALFQRPRRETEGRRRQSRVGTRQRPALRVAGRCAEGTGAGLAQRYLPFGLQPRHRREPPVPDL